VEALAAFSPDYAQVLDDVAAALHAVQVRQLVPEAARALDGVDTEALASQLAPELVQLWYQMAITGARDLALAPTPRTGFEMSLLRMLAFKPAGGGDRTSAPEPAAASRSVAVPVMSAPPVAPRKAPPSPFASHLPKAEPAAERASFAPASTSERAPVSPFAVPAAATPIASNEDWLGALERQSVSGPAGQLAAHAQFVAGDADGVTLAVTSAGQAMRTDTSVRRLSEALAPLFGRPPSLRFVEAAADGETLFDRQQRKKSQRQTEAEARFHADPVVQQLVAQGAQVLDATIRPIEE